MSNPSLEPKQNPENRYRDIRGRQRWLGNLLGQETNLKSGFQGVGMAVGFIIVRELGGNLLDMVFVGVLGGLAAGTVVGEAAVRIRRNMIANN